MINSSPGGLKQSQSKRNLHFDFTGGRRENGEIRSRSSVASACPPKLGEGGSRRSSFPANTATERRTPNPDSRDASCPLFKEADEPSALLSIDVLLRSTTLGIAGPFPLHPSATARP